MAWNNVFFFRIFRAVCLCSFTMLAKDSARRQDYYFQCIYTATHRISDIWCQKGAQYTNFDCNTQIHRTCFPPLGHYLNHCSSWFSKVNSKDAKLVQRLEQTQRCPTLFDFGIQCVFSTNCFYQLNQEYQFWICMRCGGFLRLDNNSAISNFLDANDR